MIVDRRTFMIQGATLLATVPALAVVQPCESTAQAPPMTGARGDKNAVVFKIDGWDYCDAEASKGNEVYLRINQSWRTAWR